MPPFVVRPAEPEDTQGIRSLALDNGMFEPDEMGDGAIEDELRSRGEDQARTLIVDTSSLGGYEQARSFYRRRGFVEEARIRDFYGPGDDKVTFWKSLVD